MRQMKVILVLSFYFLVVHQLVYSQGRKQRAFGCSDLKDILEKKEVVKHFRLDKVNGELIFVDTFHFFQCNQLTVNGKEIIFLDKYTEEISVGERSCFELENQNKIYLVLVSVKRNKGRYLLFIWMPNDNAIMKILLFKKRRLKIEIVERAVC
jgi:hypothetical protein